MKTRILEILSLLLALSIASLCRASNEHWETLRPTVFVVLRTAEWHWPPEQVATVIQAATHYSFAASAEEEQAEPYLPSNYENIVVIERENDWLVAFFEKGNGRVGCIINGETNISNRVSTPPRMVVVSKGDLAVTTTSAHFAQAWPPFVALGLTTAYQDKTRIETEMIETLKKSKTEPNQ